MQRFVECPASLLDPACCLSELAKPNRSHICYQDYLLTICPDPDPDPCASYLTLQCAARQFDAVLSPLDVRSIRSAEWQTDYIIDIDVGSDEAHRGVGLGIDPLRSLHPQLHMWVGTIA